MITRVVIAGALAGLMSSIVPETATQIAAIAAGAAGAGYLWKRIVVPFVQLVNRALHAFEVLEHLRPWMTQVDERFAENDERWESVDERFDRLEVRTAAIREPAEAVARELGVEHRKPAA